MELDVNRQGRPRFEDFSPLVGEGVQERAGPLFQNSPSVRDVGCAFGAALRVWVRRVRSQARRGRTPGQSPWFRPPRLPPFCSGWGGQGGGTGLEVRLPS